MVDKFFIMDHSRAETGLTDGLATLYNASAGTVSASGTMTEVGSTGRYYRTFSITTAGSYLILGDFSNSFDAGNSSTPSQVSEGFLLSTTAVTPDTVTDTATTYVHVKWRLDDLEPNLGAGSANIISQAISGANFEARTLTGLGQTDTSLTYPVADLASAEVVNTLLGRDDMSVSNERESMAKRQREQGLAKLRALGYDTKHSFTNT